MLEAYSEAGRSSHFNCFVLVERQLLRERAGPPIPMQSDLRVALRDALEEPSPQVESSVGCVIVQYSRLDGTLEEFCEAIAPLRRVLVITGALTYEELGRVRRVAAGIIVDSANSTVLVDAIRAVTKGETWRELVLLDGSLAVKAAPGRPALTYRQRRVLQYLYEGFSNKQIAGTLGVSYPSVKATVQQLFQKLGVRTRSQLVRTAIEGIDVRGTSAARFGE